MKENPDTRHLVFVKWMLFVHLNNSLPQRLVPVLGKCKASAHLLESNLILGTSQERKRCGQILIEAEQVIGDPKREEENVIEADWVDQQQCVEGCLLIQVAVAGIEIFVITV